MYMGFVLSVYGCLILNDQVSRKSSYKLHCVGVPCSTSVLHPDVVSAAQCVCTVMLPESAKPTFVYIAPISALFFNTPREMAVVWNAIPVRENEKRPVTGASKCPSLGSYALPIFVVTLLYLTVCCAPRVAYNV